MGYNYFKVVLKYAMPDSKTAREMVSSIRKTHQQAHAFSREVRKNIQDTKPLLHQAIPGLD